MAENYRILTNSEIISFTLRHPQALFSTNNYIKDDTLGGYVLVFKKADGEKVYIWSPNDPSSTDPSYWGHIIDTFTTTAAEQAKYLFKVGGIGISITALVVIAIALFILMPEIRAFLGATR